MYVSDFPPRPFYLSFPGAVLTLECMDDKGGYGSAVAPGSGLYR